jgi:hypothetical protein
MLRRQRISRLPLFSWLTACGTRPDYAQGRLRAGWLPFRPDGRLGIRGGIERFRLEGLHVGTSGGERFRLHRLRDLVASLASVAVALLGRQREPFVGLDKVDADAEAPGIEHAQIILAVGDVEIGGLGEIRGGARIVRLRRRAFAEQDGEVVGGAGIAVVACLDVPGLGCGKITRDTLAALIQAADAVLRDGEASLCCALVPFGGEARVRLPLARIGESARDFKGGDWVSLVSCDLQRRTGRDRAVEA